MAERVRAREINIEEGNRLLKIVRRSSGSIVTWRRAPIVLWSAQGMDVPQIAPLAFTSQDRVRAVIHNFNADGFDSLYPKYSGGRPPKFSPEQRREVKKVTLGRPQDYGLPFDRFRSHHVTGDRPTQPYSRRVVGWSIDSSQTANLVVNALGMAIENRKAEGVVIHSDHGTQFTSWAFTQRAVDSGLVPSMGTIGDCYDNGMMESFWARMQVELLNRRRWRTRLELANAIFEYLEIFHNRQRRHLSLGMLTPIEFERLRPTLPEIQAS